MVVNISLKKSSKLVEIVIKKNSDRSYLEAKQVKTVKVMACDVLPVAMFSPEVFSSDAPFTAHSTQLKHLNDFCFPFTACRYLPTVRCFNGFG